MIPSRVVAPLRRVRSATLWLVRAVVVLIAIVLVSIVLILAAVQTGWAKNQLRALVIRQANQYLTATLDIGRLEGSLVRGLTLGDVTLSRDGRAIFYPLGGHPTKVMRVTVETGRDGRVTIGKPESFVDWRFYSRAGSYRIYDVGADGQSLLVILRPSDTAWTRQINVVLNWTEELSRLVPISR